MPRPATGQVVVRRAKRGSVFALRFTAYGDRRYVTLGTAEDGWTRDRAEAELRHTLADVERGIWVPDAPRVHEPRDPGFHRFASDWFNANKAGWSERTIRDYEWALSHHLLPHFARHRLADITVAEVDRYRAAKLAEGRLAPAQVNKTLKRLSQILEVAEEYELIPRNPARGKRRRAKATRSPRSFVEPEQVPSLIAGGSRYMRPVIATLIGAGLRVSEATALDWTDINLATRTLRVGKAKTDAGSYREIDLPAGLVDELTDWKARSAAQLARWKQRHPRDGSPVFISAHAGQLRRQSAANVARRLKTAIRHGNRELKQLGIEEISERVTPHSLRRTFASLRAASGDDPVYIAAQLGHTDPRFTLSMYTRAVKRRSKLSGAYLAQHEGALAWAALLADEKAPKGTRADLEPASDREAFDQAVANLAR